MSFTYAQLEHFIYTAEYGSYTLAAKKLLLTSQAVSKSVHSLENKLHVKLFAYNERTLHLTVEGVKILQFAKDAVINVKALHKIAASSNDPNNKIDFKIN